MLATGPWTVGSPADHRLPSGPTTVMATNVVCSRSLKVALTRSGPVVRTALSAGLADTRVAWADATCAPIVAANARAANTRPTHAMPSSRLMPAGGPARGR